MGRRVAAACGVALLWPSIIAQAATPQLSPSPAAAATTNAAVPAPPSPPLSAAPPPAPLVAVAPPQQQTVLPTNSEVILSLNDEVSSKTSKLGDTFPLTVAYDVMLNGYIVIPKGSVATGQVSWRTGKGAFGKSAKMEITMQYVEVGGRRIPLEGKFRQEGEGNTGATVGTAVAVGVFSAFVTGRSAIFAKDREFKTHTKEALPVQLAAGPPPVQIPVAAIQPATTTVVQQAQPAIAKPAVLQQAPAATGAAGSR